MRERIFRIPSREPRDPAVPDLHTQLEELLGEVWLQESFERTHPFTCATMREPVRQRAGLVSTAA